MFYKIKVNKGEIKMENLEPIKKTKFIEAERTALVVIDLQMGIVNREASPFTGKEVVQNASRLINAFAEKGAFVVLVKISSVDGKDMLKPNTDSKINSAPLPKGWDSFVPELINVKNVHHIIKRQWGAFYGTDLDLQLRRRGIDTIVLCGVSTNIGVDTTAREAYQHGYNQIFSTDAMTASTKEEHDYVCKYIFPRIGQLRTTEEIVLSLA
jgi:nicotinamidase-related amidase